MIECHKCGYRFTQASNLRLHIKENKCKILLVDFEQQIDEGALEDEKELPAKDASNDPCKAS